MMHVMVTYASRVEIESIVREEIRRYLSGDAAWRAGSGRGPRRRVLADAVRAEFARRDLPKGKLADVIGKSVPAAAGRMSGAYAFDADEIDKIAAFLGMTAYDLHTLAEHGARFTGLGTDDPTPSGDMDVMAQPPRARRPRPTAW
ncbi:MAG: hypothetical protein K0S37_1341 [Microbacterium sp.]|jgi:hypothetical protein|nr:hypothetical protein [Microbacterium sp.]